MPTGKEYRDKAIHCRGLARSMDDRTKACLETLALSYDDSAKQADLAVIKAAGNQLPNPR
jgi:hypothetical protein